MPNKAIKNTRANAHAGTELWMNVWYKPLILVSPVRGCPVIQAVIIAEARMPIRPVAAFANSFFMWPADQTSCAAFENFVIPIWKFHSGPIAWTNATSRPAAVLTGRPFHSYGLAVWLSPGRILQLPREVLKAASAYGRARCWECPQAKRERLLSLTQRFF